VFRYQRTSDATDTVAVASGAAVYLSDGTIIALGNRELTWRRAAQAPDQIVTAQVALMPTHPGEITVNSVGLPSTAALLARSTITMAADHALINTATAVDGATMRKLVVYAYPARAAWVIATAPVAAAISANWSPDGKFVALIDASEQPNRLTVVASPR
jgi:hypothetical protein